MTKTQFDKTEFCITTKVLYEGKQYKVAGVDFSDRTILIRITPRETVWVSFGDCIIK